jgi:hypothetical protein
MYGNTLKLNYVTQLKILNTFRPIIFFPSHLRVQVLKYVCGYSSPFLLGWACWSYFTKTKCTCLFIWEPVGASVRLVHPRTWFKPPAANCFATDRSKAVTYRVLNFVNCLWCLFWNWSVYNHVLFPSLLFGCVGRLCLLDVAIPDMRV